MGYSSYEDPGRDLPQFSKCDRCKQEIRTDDLCEVPNPDGYLHVCIDCYDAACEEECYQSQERT